MKSDIEIAHENAMKPIAEVYAPRGLVADEDFETYGKYKAKATERCLSARANAKEGKLVLVTAISPTPAGEGKTTTAIGLADGLNRIGVSAALALREPSMGPVFGLKGGACGGGYAQVQPMEDINLHFMGDFHAITSANNLLCAIVDNHLKFGNALNLNPTAVAVRRCLDVNDRELRNCVVGLGGSANGYPREEHFQITVASEIMAVVCLAENLADLRARLERMVVGYDVAGNPVTAGALNCVGALVALLKDAIRPNLAQSLEHTPALIHGGPFANIAHGCNSVRATRLALALADVAVTEAGFGADLGAEKFLDIKCRQAGLAPSCVVLVASIRALKYNGGVAKAELSAPNENALLEGLSSNFARHYENLRRFGVPVVVAFNRFATDSAGEIETARKFCAERGILYAFNTAFADGGAGAVDLATAVKNALEENPVPNFLYGLEESLFAKMKKLAAYYGADGVNYAGTALKKAKSLEFCGLPVCVAKTQYSFSDDPAKVGAPTGFTLTVRDFSVSAGAGFVVAYLGDILTMPGLPAKPAACAIEVADDGTVSGLF